jgi:hypothetical protein
VRWRRDVSIKEAAAAVSLGPAERVLAAARAGDGRWVVGTDRQLYLPDQAGESYDVLAWERIDAATWEKDDDRLVVNLLPLDGMAARRLAVSLPEPGRLPELVRERVMATIVLNEHVPLVGRRGARVVGRRPPAGGSVLWTVVFDRGVAGDDPDVRAALDARVAELQAGLGV